MRYAKMIAAACAGVLALTLLFTWLPRLADNRNGEYREVAVYRAAPIARMTSSNLVDVFVGISLHEPLRSVKWNGSILTVTFSVDGENDRPPDWFEDVEKLLRASFLQLENVKRVLIRFVEDEPQKGTLLLAVDVRKTDGWLYEDFEELKDSDPVHDERWRGRLRLSFTAAWEERFGPSSSYSVSPMKQR